MTCSSLVCFLFSSPLSFFFSSFFSLLFIFFSFSFHFLFISLSPLISFFKICSENRRVATESGELLAKSIHEEFLKQGVKGNQDGEGEWDREDREERREDRRENSEQRGREKRVKVSLTIPLGLMVA